MEGKKSVDGYKTCSQQTIQCILTRLAASVEMTKTINPDVAAFKDDFFKGLSFRECIFGGSALLVGVGGILLLHFYFKMGINSAITICMPVIGIIGLCGFYHKNGMTLVQLVRSTIRLMLQKPYVYETRNCLKEWEAEDEEKGTKRKTGKRRL